MKTTKSRSIIRKAPNNFEGCADRCNKDADYRKCMHENSRTYETMEIGQNPVMTSEDAHDNAAAKAGELWEPVVCC